VPGDVISLTRGGDDDVIPCDCVLLHGKCVVNEAILTGESVPQMKEGLVVDETTRDRRLDVTGLHKANALWGGTRVLQATGGNAAGAIEVSDDEHSGDEGENQLLAPQGAPDGGCLCVVLRTGFSSSQGKVGWAISVGEAHEPPSLSPWRDFRCF